ncbi:MAG: MFS transporter [Candidatus Binatia bacterium]|nr:MFS transporter [Candidatus Binatia bacterium]
MSQETIQHTSAQRRWILMSMTAVLSMVMMNETTVAVALPSIARDLGMSVHRSSAVISVYILSFASFVAFGGRLGDLFGRRNFLIIGILVFFLAALACGFARSREVLLGARFIQGIGAALMVPASAAIVVNNFSLEERGRVMAIYAGIAQVFLSFAPVIGGVLTENFGWGSIFFMNLPIVIACFVAMLLGRVPNRATPGGQLDLAGALILPPSLFAFVLAIQEGSSWGWTSVRVWTFLVGGLTLFIVFYFLERRREQPLINFLLLRISAFRVDAVILFCVQFSIAAMAVYGVLYVQRVLKFSPLGSGAAQLAMAIPLLLVTQVAGRIFDRMGARRLVLSGMGLATTGCFVVAGVITLESFPAYAFGLALIGAGFGMTLTPVNADALSRIPASFRGQASGILQTMRQAGGALGIAAMTAVVALVVSATPGASGHPEMQTHAFRWAFALAGLINLLGFAAAFFLPPGRQAVEPVDLAGAMQPPLP